MPWTMAGIVLLGLGLIGVPFTSGFISKWYVLSAAIEQGHWLGAVVVVGGSLLAILYIWKIIEQAYFRTPVSAAKRTTAALEAPLSMLIPLWVLVAGNFYLGLDHILQPWLCEHCHACILSVSHDPAPRTS